MYNKHLSFYSAFDNLKQLIISDRASWPLWLPVGLGIGIYLYLCLSITISFGNLAFIITLSAASCFYWREHTTIMVIMTAILTISLGLLTTELRVAKLMHHPITQEIPPLAIEARVDKVEILDQKKQRLTICNITGNASPLPKCARITISNRLINQKAISIGDIIAGQVTFMPLSGPVMPDMADYRRQLWFKGIDASGYSNQEIKIITSNQNHRFITDLRSFIGQRITEIIKGTSGIIAKALIIGERGELTDATEKAWRDSGITHVLSISGLHITLAAGVIFFITRIFLEMLPLVRLRINVKKIAAVAAILSAIFYTILSGSDIPAIRSAIMTNLLFIAIIIDRRALSLRLVACAAGLILLFLPESLIDVGFDMSFASVTALIAVYEAMSKKMTNWHEYWKGSIFSRLILVIITLILTSIIATIATMPFTLSVFGRIGLYGVISNILVIPITGLIIMPFAVIALLLMPFTLDSWALIIMGLGVEACDYIACYVASWPGAVIIAPIMPNIAFITTIIGGLWFCLWRGKQRYLGLITIPITAILWIYTQTYYPGLPDIVIHEQGQAIIITDKDGIIRLLRPAKPNFVVNQWKTYFGLDHFAKISACSTKTSCQLESLRGAKITIDLQGNIIESACPDIIIGNLTKELACKNKILTINESLLQEKGTMAIWWHDKEPAIWQSKNPIPNRPWQ